MRASLWKEPLILNHNRVKRAYVGGRLLDEWQGIEPARDGQYPEEFLISTVEVTNADRYPGEGMSKITLDDGREATLKEVIAHDPAAFLGEAYAKAMNGELGVLARVGDPTVRHVIQTHPKQELANRYLDFPYGKDEVWYVIKTRQIDGETNFAYAGFKPGLTRQKWQALFEAQDIEGMLDAMHKLDGVREGDVLLIPAGMPHAIGPGSLFLEVHEPCDYTFRMERKYLTGRVFSDHEIH
jgi:mannose-6-phosphate isomerase